MRGQIENHDAENREYIVLIVKALTSANKFMKTLFHSSIWLLDHERNAAIMHGQLVLLYFRKLAAIAYSWEITRWKFQTKFHFFAEILLGLHLERKHDLPSLNPLSTSTQLDEDFVGKISAASRVVSSRTLHRRTIERYCVQLRVNW